MYKGVKQRVYKGLIFIFVFVLLLQCLTITSTAKSFSDFTSTERLEEGTYAKDDGSIESTKDTLMPYKYDFYLQNIKDVTVVVRSHNGKTVTVDGEDKENLVDAATKKADGTYEKKFSSGEYYVWYRNIGKYKNDYLDLKMVLTDYKIKEGAEETALLRFKDNLANEIRGVEWVKIKLEFYKHDDSIPNDKNRLDEQEEENNICGFYTVTDIDAHQGIVFTEKSKLIKTYVTKGNEWLKHATVQEGEYFYAKGSENEPKTYKTYLTSLFDTGNSNSFSVIYSYPYANSRSFEVISNSGTKVMPTQIPEPVKKVSDNNENKVESNTLSTSTENFTYNITHQVPLEPAEFYYDSYEITDQIPDGLEIVSTNIVDETGKNYNTYFDVTKTNNKISIKSNACQQKDFYYKTYTFNITVKISNLSAVEKYYNSNTGNIEIPNTANLKVQQPYYMLNNEDNESAEKEKVYKTYTTSTNQVTTKMPIGKIKVTKKDSITGEMLSGAIIGIYTDSACTNKVTSLTTGNDGIASTGFIDAGTYYVKELGAPTNYVINNNIQKLYVLSGKITDATVENQPNTARVEVSKIDNDTGGIITRNDTIFALYEWSTSEGTWVKPTHIQTSTFNGTVSDGKGAILKEKTNGTKGTYSGTMYYNAQNQGKFRVVEYARPWGYTTSNWTADIQITQDGQVFTYSSQVRNNQIKGQINFEKKDFEINYNKQDYEDNYAQGDATLQGAVYGLYAKEDIKSLDNGNVLYSAGQEIAKGTTDKDGKITWDDLYLGKYYIQEITPSKGYLIDSTQYEIDLETYYHNNYFLQGDQTTSKIVYCNTSADTQYENPEQRVISKEKIKKQSFQLTKLSLSENSTMANPLEKAGFKIYLIKDISKVKDGTIVPDANGNYNIEDFKKVDYTNEQTALDFTNSVNGERIAEIFSNEDGILTSPELAYGKYIVIESTVPEDYVAIEPFIVDIQEDNRTPKKMIYPIDREFEARIKITKKDDTTGRVVLKANAAYRIWDITKNQYVEQWVTYPNKVQYGTENNPYRTTNEGYLLTPDTLKIGEYELIEVQAPEGYVLAGQEAENPRTNVRFTISTNTVYEIDPDLGTQNAIITVEQNNTPQVGTITVLKQGEYLSNAQEIEEGYKFDYTQRPVANAKFAIYAKEDIYTQDNQTDENGERYKIYEKNQFIKEIETNEEGKAIFEKLPLGKYYIKETKAGEGFILNTEQKEVELTYEGQDTPIIYKDSEYTNERQKVEINITKKDREEGTLLEGATFGLYTKSEINYLDDSGNTQTIPADKLLLKSISGENGVATFNDKSLPLGQYYIKELQAPEGYATNVQTIDINCSYAGQEQDKVINNLDFTNMIIKLKIRVLDYETGVDLNNTQIGLKDENGNIVGTYTIDENGEIEIKGLNAGKQYSIEELKERYGYVKELLFSNEIQDSSELVKGKDVNGLVTFIIKDSEEQQKVTLSNIAKVGKIEIEKIGEVLVDTEQDENENTIFKYENRRIDIAKFEITAKEDLIHPDGKQGVIVPAGTKIGEGQTENGILIITKFEDELIQTQPEIVQLLLNRGLPLGNYEIKETQAPQGYYFNQEDQIKTVQIKSNDNKEQVEKQTITIENPRQSTNIGKINPNILVEKKAEKEIYKVGEQVIYTIKVSNTGNMRLKNVEIKETMINGEFDEAEGTTKKDNNTITIEKLEKAEEKTLIYRYNIPEKTKGEIDNEVTATGIPVKVVTTPDGNEIEEPLEKITNDAEEKVWVETVLEKTANKKMYRPGEIVEYTLNILNPNDEKIENAEIEDEKVSKGSILRASKEGITITENGVISIGSIEARERVEIVYQYQIPEDYTDNTLTNKAKLSGTINMNPITPEEATTTVEIKKSGIAITKQAEKEIYQKGEIVNYTIKVTNTGETILKDITVQEELINGKFEENSEMQLINNQTGKIDKLEIGQSVTLTYKYTVQEDRITGEKIYNKVIAKGTGIIENLDEPNNPTTEEVTDEADKDIIVKYTDMDLGVYKTDVETGQPIDGATFGLYTAEDIIGTDNNILITKDSLIEKTTTDKDGYAKFAADLPLGKFYILEIKPKAGYIKNNEKLEIDSTGLSTYEKEYKVRLETKNKKTEINIEKVEKTEELAQKTPIIGAKLQILDEEVNVIEEWTTDGNPYNRKGLETEKEYTLHEIEPAKGYVTTDDIKFSINLDGNLKIDEIYTIQGTEIPTIIMQDDITRIKVNVVDKETKEPVKDVVVQIVDKNTGEVVYEFTTDGEEQIIEKIPIGDYEIVEKDFPKDKGYVSIDTEEFTIEDTPEIQEKIIEQDFTKLDVTFLDEITKELLPKGKLEIRNDKGETIATIDDTGVKYYVERLPIGEYTLVETGVPEGYEPWNEIKFTLKDTSEVQHVVVENKRLPFDLKVEKYASEISVNGVKQAGTDYENAGQLVKVEIDAKKIKNQNVQIIYTIRLTNSGEVSGSVGKIIDNIPSGFKFDTTKNESYWNAESNSVITTTKFSDKKLQPGEFIELKMVLDWTQSEFNLGNKVNVVSIGQFSNNPGFEDEDESNNSSTSNVLLSVKTGLEIVLTKKITVIVLMTLIAIGIMALIEIKIINKKNN